jgi:hypothetical protein
MEEKTIKERLIEAGENKLFLALRTTPRPRPSRSIPLSKIFWKSCLAGRISLIKPQVERLVADYGARKRRLWNSQAGH